jgi:transposase
MTHSLELRKQDIKYVESGGSQLEATTIFGVTSRTIWNWIQRKSRVY